MSLVIPKLFHKILAKRLETFLLSNGIINFSLQKGFLTGITGTAEPIFTTTATIQHGIPLAVTFLDQNAFGSVAHALITDILVHIKLPSGRISHILDGYTKLSATVKTKEWKTPPFEIKWGMFQGDTLSPVIFLTVFNPLVEFSNHLPTCGFSLKVPVPNSVVLTVFHPDILKLPFLPHALPGIGKKMSMNTAVESSKIPLSRNAWHCLWTQISYLATNFHMSPLHS